MNEPTFLRPTETGGLSGFIVEDVTDRMMEETMLIDTTWSFDVTARLEKAERIGDVIRSRWVYNLFSCTGPTPNHFEEWYAFRNEGGNCKLIPIDYQTAAKINHGVREFLRSKSPSLARP